MEEKTMSDTFDELITKACELVVAQEAERFGGIDTSGVEDGRKETKCQRLITGDITTRMKR